MSPGRLLGLVCAGLAASAALLWAGSATVWQRVPGGGAPLELTGAQVAPWLTGTALLALAGVAGVVAAGGVLRRLVGALLGLAGIGAAVFALRALLAPAAVTVDGVRHEPGEPTAAPLLAVAGAMVLLAVGIAVLVRERGLPRLGARYAAPGGRAVERDPDRAAWQELDEGRDPTVDYSEDPPGESPGDAGDDPGDGPRSTAV